MSNRAVAYVVISGAKFSRDGKKVNLLGAESVHLSKDMALEALANIRWPNGDEVIIECDLIFNAEDR